MIPRIEGTPPPLLPPPPVDLVLHVCARERPLRTVLYMKTISGTSLISNKLSPKRYCIPEGIKKLGRKKSRLVVFNDTQEF